MGLAALQQRAFEQRRFSRARLSLKGKIFLPAEELTMDCRVVDLSLGGAGVVCVEPPPLRAFVQLYVDGFDRFEAVSVRMIGDTLGLKLLLSGAKRERLFQTLSRYIETGQLEATALRRHRRLKGSASACVTRQGGDRQTCDIIDISLTGASLKTEGAFAVGETIKLGHMPARVVRLHDQGIGVVF
jgi:hypothetical protein